jgi:phosphoglycolate phosphatase
LRFTRPYPDIVDVLLRLQCQAALAVLTNKPLDATRAILDGLELGRFFGARVLGGDGPFPRKPDRAGLVHLMEGAGVAPDETLLVGDSVIDLRTAHAAGAHICLARYGFGFEGFPAGELRESDSVLDRPADLLALATS